jgi:hypothetical protein
LQRRATAAAASVAAECVSVRKQWADNNVGKQSGCGKDTNCGERKEAKTKGNHRCRTVAIMVQHDAAGSGEERIFE